MQSMDVSIRFISMPNVRFTNMPKTYLHFKVVVVCLFLVSSSGTDDKYSDLPFNTHYIFIGPNTYYISLTLCTNCRVKD